MFEASFVMIEESDQRLERLESLAKALLKSTEAIEKEDFVACEKSAYSAASLARMLMLSDRAKAKEKKDAS
jgi:hypothetical protein